MANFGLFGQPINPIAMGLLGAGAGLLGAAGPSTQPTGWGPALAQGLLGLQGGYGDALKQSLLMEEFRQAQEKDAREAAAAQQEANARAAYQAALGGGDPRLAAMALGGIPGQEGAALKRVFPEPQKPYEVGGALIDPTTFQPIYQTPVDPLKEEATRALIAQREAATAASNAKAANLVAGGPETTAALKTRRQQIDDMRRLNPGMDEATATGIVDGYVSVYQSETGEPFIINKAQTGAQAIKVPGINFDLPKETREALATQISATNAVEPFLDSLITQFSQPETGSPASRATGLRSFGQRTALEPLTQFWPDLTDAEAQALRQNVAALQQELVSSFINNPKFPVAEQERIRKEILNLDVGPGSSRVNVLTALKTIRETILRARAGAQKTLTGGQSEIGAVPTQPSGTAPDGSRVQAGSKVYVKRNGQWFEE